MDQSNGDRYEVTVLREELFALRRWVRGTIGLIVLVGLAGAAAGTQLKGDLTILGLLRCAGLEVDGKNVVHELDRKAELPVGTVVASVFPWDVWRTQYPEVASRWLTADGRPVGSETAYARTAASVFTGRSPPPPLVDRRSEGASPVVTIPDLRGTLLRGLNQNDPARGLGDPAKMDPDGNLRPAGSWQADQITTHRHFTPRKELEAQSGGGFRGTGYTSNSNGTETSLPTTGPSTNSGAETRPRNVSVYYYIKVN